MNWSRLLLGGLLGGVALDLANFVMHGFILRTAYVKYPVFTQEAANPAYFVLTDVMIGLAAALLFMRSRSAWPAGAAGGALFGVLLGLVLFFPPFYNPLVLEGFPYHLSWCWGGVNLIGYTLLGLVLGLVIRKS